ncbi:MAG: DEAD/DEAH box helicase [Candidatus Paceibacterota bacterium]|jgi:replicative superfamily II helicase
MEQTIITKFSQKIINDPTFKSRFAEVQNNASRIRLAFDQEILCDEKISKLLLQGSVLAFSDDIAHRAIAQKINALLHETNSGKELVSYAIQILSSRIGNFPVIRLSSQVFGENNILRRIEERSESVSVFDPEIISSLYEEEDKARLQIRDKVFHFNWYQKEILEALSNKSLVSFSAPTSFGKSFIVRHHIARQFAEGNISRALIIVPTKSLIDDFYEGVSNLKNELRLDFTVYTHARSVDAVSDNSIFILTQERLTFLLDKNPEFVRSFQVIYCDEAHYISRGYRGFVLRSVLQKVVNLNGIRGVVGDTQYIFSSPLIRNPQYYKEHFFENLNKSLFFHREVLYSPVEKNIHFVVKKPTSFSFMLFRDSLANESFEEKLEEIGVRTFPQNLCDLTPENSKSKEIERDINIVLSSNLKDQSILYVTSPLQAHKYASVLAEKLPEKTTIPPHELADIKRYIRDHYDESFGLIELIKKGVGLHYGKMPVGLRRAIVKLFEGGYLDYIVCTSTLLEGVNLPAKNIFLFSDKHSREVHSTLSFWNLVGRAGRITYGLSGNVFCITNAPQEYKELLENKETEIKDPENEVSENKTKRTYVISSFMKEGGEFSYLKSKSRADIEYLLYELFTSNNVTSIINRFGLSSQEQEALISAINNQRDLLRIPLDLLKKNAGIDPRLQNNLMNTLAEFSLEDLGALFDLVSSPLTVNGEKLNRILQKTSDSLMWPMRSEKYDRIDYISRRASQWLHEFSISQFIQQSLKHYPDISNIEKVEKALSVVDTLDRDISYDAPKYIKCFFDIVNYVASIKGMTSLDTYEEKVETFLFSIESGVSSLVGRFLFEKGVARPVAIRTNILVHEMANGIITSAFFSNPEVLRKMREGLSSIAFNEVMEHLDI